MDALISRAIEAAAAGSVEDRQRLLRALRAAQSALGHCQFELKRRNDKSAMEWADKAETEFLRVWLAE